jgi:hypothetical protein
MGWLLLGWGQGIPAKRQDKEVKGQSGFAFLQYGIILSGVSAARLD